MLWHKTIGAGGQGGEVSLDLSFYECRNGSTIGTINVYVVNTSGVIQGSSVYTADDDLGTPTWFLRTADSPVVTGSFRIAWHYVSGGTFRGDYAIDTVSIQGVGYSFSNLTGWVTSNVDTASSETALSSASNLLLTTSNDLGRWNANTGSTPSSNTGPDGGQDGGAYAYTETSSPNYPNVNMWLFSPVVTP